MANILANLPLNAGQTGLTLFLYSLSDGTLLNPGGDSLTELNNGIFQATVDDAEIPDADVRADVKNIALSIVDSDILYAGQSLIGSQPQIGLLDQISDSLGSSTGRNVTITVFDGTSNIPYAPVQLLNVSDVPIGGIRTTGSQGTLTLNLEDGDYKFVVSNMNGYETHVAESLNVSPSTVSKTLTLTPVVQAAATDPALCSVLVRVLNQYGQRVEGASVSARIDSPDFLLNSVVSNELSNASLTNSSGEATLTLIRAAQFIRGGKYEIMIKVGNSTQKFDYYVPNQGSAVATFTG